MGRKAYWVSSRQPGCRNAKRYKVTRLFFMDLGKNEITVSASANDNAGVAGFELYLEINGLNVVRHMWQLC
jgi:hypothetical protein